MCREDEGAPRIVKAGPGEDALNMTLRHRKDLKDLEAEGQLFSILIENGVGGKDIEIVIRGLMMITRRKNFLPGKVDKY